MSKKLSILIITLTLTAVAAGAYFVISDNLNADSSNSDAANTNLQEEQHNSDDAGSENTSQTTQETEAEPLPTKTDPEQTENAAESEATITSLSIEEGALVIQTSLGNITDGVCTVSIRVGSETVERAADVIFAPGNSFCGGYSVPLSELPSGNASVALSVESNGQTYSSNTEEIQL